MAMMSDHATRLSVDFDRQEDVLYISLGTPQPSYADEAGRGVLLRWANIDNNPSGVTAFDFQANWQEDRHKFCSIVAQHLHIPLQIVESEIERAL